MKSRIKKSAKAKTTKRLVITTVLIAVVLLSTSAWIITSKAEEQAKSKIILANKEAAIEVVSKQNSINTPASNQEVVHKELLRADKLANELEAKKAKEKEAKEVKEKEELAKKAKSDKLAKIAADKVKLAEASKLAIIAADKAKQEEIDRIAANSVNKAKIDAEYKIAKAASEKVEKEKADKLAKIEIDRLAKVETDRLAKLEVDRLAKEAAELRPKDDTQTDGIDEVETERLAKIELDRLAKLKKDEIDKKEADRVAGLGFKQTANGAKLSAYLKSAANVSSVVNEAVRLHKSQLSGDPTINNCVYFSSESMRRIGVYLSPLTRNTQGYLNYFNSKKWVRSYHIENLSPGSICFTTNSGAGYPTHTFVFMGWVNNGNYTSAYVADNQGEAVHVRNMGATKETDAFAFFVYN
jgi:hypothetical protein